jgi:hypothetical protein
MRQQEIGRGKIRDEGDRAVVETARRKNLAFTAAIRVEEKNGRAVRQMSCLQLLGASGQRRDEPQPDLAHTLRRWQEAGIAIELKRLDSPAPPAAIEVRKPSGFGRIWHRALDLLGLRRHALGGYGGFIPQPSSG